MQAPQDSSQYKQLVERAKKGDPGVDFAQLREAYSVWIDDEKNRASHPRRGEMVEAFKKQDYAKAVELAEIVLDTEFINRGLHLATEDAYRKLGDTTKADFHRDIAQKLMKAILGTGDGKSPQTAYRVMNIREEYVVMAELGYEVSSQALVTTKEGGVYDVLSGKDKKTGKDVEVYFDISNFFGGGRKTKK